jgi:hypothetical protein|tara:strand:+ start:1727 stop:1978 length:252 start_codon:yes stop_codon:yes gene_type:complete
MITVNIKQADFALTAHDTGAGFTVTNGPLVFDFDANGSLVSSNCRPESMQMHVALKVAARHVKVKRMPISNAEARRAERLANL